MMRDSAAVMVANAIRAGMFPRRRPESTVASGRCVASTRWMPTARAIEASCTSGFSASGSAEQQVGELVDDHDDLRPRLVGIVPGVAR